MSAIKLPNGNLLIPVRAESDDGIIGDAMLEIDESNPLYTEWLQYLDANNQTTDETEPDGV